MALQETAINQERVEQEATNVRMEFVCVKQEPFEEPGVMVKTEVIQIINKEERDGDEVYTDIMKCEKEEQIPNVHMEPGAMDSQTAVPLEPTKSDVEYHYPPDDSDDQYQQHEAPSFDESQVKLTQDKDSNRKLPAALETMATKTAPSAKKKEGSKRLKKRNQYVSLHHKLLESQLELVKLINKNAESQRNIKSAILEEQLKQEILKSKGVELLFNL